MSDRYSKLLVVLDSDYRSEDIEALMQSISMLRGVSAVTMGASSFEEVTARMRVKTELATKVYDALRGIFL